MKWLRDLFTDNNGDADIVSSLGCLSVVVFLALSIYTTINTGDFKYGEFGAAIGMMLAGLGGGYFAKSNTPQAEKEPDKAE
jgi:hypothetical protein